MGQRPARGKWARWDPAPSDERELIPTGRSGHVDPVIASKFFYSRLFVACPP